MMICNYCIHNKVCPNDESIIYVEQVEGVINDEWCPDYIDKWDEEKAKEAGDGEDDNTFIKLEGCDDSTIFAMKLTEAEFDFLRRVSEKANKVSNYNCMPRLYVAPLRKEKQNDS